MGNFNNLLVGTLVTGISTDCYINNYKVIAVGINWAVLEEFPTGGIFRYVLEPDDDFLVGVHIWDDKLQCYEVKEGR